MKKIFQKPPAFKLKRWAAFLNVILASQITPALAANNLSINTLIKSEGIAIQSSATKLPQLAQVDPVNIKMKEDRVIPDDKGGRETGNTMTHPIKLRSSTITEGSEGDTKRRQALTQIENNANADGRVHLLIQFNSIPTPKEKNQLKKQGIELLSYVPDYAWVASINAQSLTEVKALPEVSWIGALLLEDKVSKSVLSKNFSKWHYDQTNGLVAVVIHFHKDVSLDNGRDLIENYGGEVKSETKSINAITAHLPESTLHNLALNQAIEFIETVTPALETNNDGFQSAQNVDILQPNPFGTSTDYNLDGEGIDVLVFDGGQVDDHIDFGLRLVHGDTAAVSDHATHVAGTLGGDGTNSAAEGGSALEYHGVAPEVGIISYGVNLSGSSTFFYTDIGDIESDWDDAKNDHGADLGTASLGSNIAANSAIDPTNFYCDLEGDYGAASELMDAIVRGSLGEPYISTWAAGNERSTGNCGTGYSTTAPPACAKNPIHVGASNSNDDSMTSFSSWGPCDDGRLKPVITASGCEAGGDFGITSTSATNADGYTVKCGTSMATPGVAGIVTQMLEQYRDSYFTTDEFLPSTAKAVLMNSSVDAGNPGPDFQFGYGLVEAQAAVDTIIDGRFREASLEANGEVDEYAIRILGGSPTLQVSLAWDDPEASAYTADALVNDVDLELISPTGVVHQPWILDPANPANNATTGVDDLNNQEQITIASPEVGIWRLRVQGSLLPVAPQQYSLAGSHSLISLDILSPETSASVTVGPHDEPETLLIRLAIRDDHGGSLSAPVLPSDLDIEVGGEAVDNILLSSAVGNEYWVLATPPIQTASGCYDLDVSLYDVLEETETNSVCYSASMEKDVILTMDISGSMATSEKLQAAKDASQFFITLTDVDDQIGVVSFATESDSMRTQLAYPLTTITGDAQKNAASLAIEGFTANGMTALGRGMEIANDEMITNGDASHEQTLILLTDGKENQATTWASIEPAIPANTVIHTVGLGPEGDPDDVLLSQIASDHNGDFWRVYTGTGPSAGTSLATTTTNILADVYRRAAEETLGWQRIWEAKGSGLTLTTNLRIQPAALSVDSQNGSTLPQVVKKPGELLKTPNLDRLQSVPVEPNLEKIVFAAHWNEGNYPQGIVNLFRPDGSLVNTGDADVAGHRVYGSSGGHEQYVIQNPQSGNWKLGIHSLQGEDAEYIVMVEAKSDAELLLLSPTALSEGACSSVSIRAAFIDHAPILGASVNATLTETDGTVRSLELFDDGEHDDGQADDGLYARTYNPCLSFTTGVALVDSPQTIQLKVVADGVSNFNLPISRNATKSFVTSPRKFIELLKPDIFQPLIPFEPMFDFQQKINPIIKDPAKGNPVIKDPKITNPVIGKSTISDPVIMEPIKLDPTISDPVISKPTKVESLLQKLGKLIN